LHRLFRPLDEGAGEFEDKERLPQVNLQPKDREVDEMEWQSARGNIDLLFEAIVQCSIRDGLTIAKMGCGRE
jgi:hypothetical protein